MPEAAVDPTRAAIVAMTVLPLWVGTTALAASEPRAPEIVEYWTIAANEGESAGGHTALRIDDVVHHLEHRGDGLLQDRRDARGAFEAAYRGRDNRAIRVLRFDLDARRARALDVGLRTRALARRLRLDALEAVDEEIRWLDRTLEQGAATIDVPGLGLFGDAPARCSDETGARLPSGVRERLTRARARAWRDRDAALALATRTDPGEGSFRPLFEATQLAAALDVLAGCRPVHARALVQPARLPPLSPAELRAWRTLEARLERAVVRLVESERPDRGLALLLAWGRLQAARHSVVSQRWTFVDAFAETDGPAVRLDPLPAAARAERLQGFETRFAHARAALQEAADSAVFEPWLDRVERLAHDTAHAVEGSRHGPPGPRGALQTSRALERPGAAVALPWPEGADLEALRARRSRLRTQRRRLRDALEVDLAYDLVERNCVTELLDALRESDVAQPRGTGLASFAPAFAHAELARVAGASPRPVRPSARHATLEQALADRDRPAQRGWLRIRESNTLTSRFYRPHAEDSAFLFFADGPLALRPFAGISNLVWGSGASLVGLFTAPFDRGTQLTRGVQGIALSLPEIAFVPIRKGSYVVALPVDDPG